MKNTALLVLVSIVINANAQTGSITSQLQQFRSDYTSSMLKGDLSVLHYCDVNVRLMPEYSMTIVTQSNATRYYQSFHAAFDVTAFSMTSSEVLDMGSYIVDWGTFSMKVNHRATNKQYSLPGKYMDLWRKDATGKISIVCQAWNYTQRIDISEELKFSNVPVRNVALSARSPVVDRISFELAGLNELMESIVIQHDARLWKMFYTDDANFLYSNSPVYLGRQAIDEFLDEHVRGLPVFEKLDIRNDEIIDLGAYVIEYASHTAFVRGENWSGAGTGKDLRIWRREADCSLKIFRHIGMYD
jgi:ketosteroid isomerase-like protein